MKISILTSSIIIFWLIIDYISGKKIYKEVNNIRNISQEKFKKIYIICSIILLFVHNISYLLFSDIHLYWILNILLTLTLGTGLVSLYTDPILKKVNRHSLRFVYLINMILTIVYSILTVVYSMQPYIENSLILYVVPLFTSYLVLLLFLFFSNEIGASDIRALMIILPLYIIIFNSYLSLIILLHLFAIRFIFIIIKAKKKKSIPICHWILLPAYLISVIALFFNK